MGLISDYYKTLSGVIVGGEVIKGPLVYIATNKETGKQYVGQTINLRKRFIRYRASSKTHFERALGKRGLGGFSILLIPYPKDELNHWERFWIAKLNTVWPNGYNHTTGGDTFKKSQASIDSMRKKMVGKHHTEETKKKISNWHLGFRHSDETKDRLTKINRERIDSMTDVEKSSKFGNSGWLTRMKNFYAKHPERKSRSKNKELVRKIDAGEI